MNQFDDIRPYRDDEVRATINRLVNDKEFISVVARFRFPAYPNWLVAILNPIVKLYVRKQTNGIHTVHDLQLLVARYVARMLRETSLGLTVSGDEHLNKSKSYLFISNHRDIVVDPAMVNWALHHKGYHTLQIAIGDNLLTKPYVSDLMRLNKSFIVNRSATKPREKFKAAKYLSAYIHHAIVEEDDNVWIAQREGRAKDGLDHTNSAVIGMLALSKPKDVDLTIYIKQLNIVPVSISYERDPCDIAKADELYAHKLAGEYKKGEHEDAQSIAKGITGFKGRIHVAFGAPLRGDYENTDQIVAEIDKKIIQNYVLQPSNCIAYEELHGQLPEEITVTHQKIPFREGEFVTEMRQFHHHLAKCDEAYRDILLNMYANPIVSQQSQKD
ncbi:MAG: 1-acyl-sn-glycerol-3-phosphate acyltransferase [Cellvibrionaceae bacterium]|jgi:1-acyl-sn-glycerol-3-phosphate acyltransferase